MFEEDLQLGQKAEEYILAMLKKEFPTIKRVNGYQPDYDFIDDDGYTIELKLDIRSKSSGNVGIEYKYKNKPSAISTSKAVEWIVIYYLPPYKWVYSRMKTNELKAFLKGNNKYLRKTNGGDSNMSRLILIPIVTFSEEFGFTPLKT